MFSSVPFSKESSQQKRHWPVAEKEQLAGMDGPSIMHLPPEKKCKYILKQVWMVESRVWQYDWLPTKSNTFSDKWPNCFLLATFLLLEGEGQRLWANSKATTLTNSCCGSGSCISGTVWIQTVSLFSVTSLINVWKVCPPLKHFC